MSELVPLSGHYLVPAQAIESTIVRALPGHLNYEGQVVVALTSNAFWMVAPDREHVMIPFLNLRSARPDHFPGIVYEEYVDGVLTLVAPNDTAGVTVEYQGVGNFIYRLSFLTFYPNKALEWARKIEATVQAFSLRRYTGRN